MKSTLLTFTFFAVLLSCKNKSEFYSNTISINLNGETEYFIDSVAFTPLQTNKESIFGGYDKSYFNNEVIIILDKKVTKSLYVFDSIGQYKGKYKNKGKGPEDIMGDIIDFQFDENIFLLSDLGEVVCLNKDCKFKWKQNTGFMARKFTLLENGYAFYFLYHRTAQNKFGKAYFNVIEVDKNFKLKNKYQKFSLEDDRIRISNSLNSTSNQTFLVPNLSDSIILMNGGEVNSIRFNLKNHHTLKQINDKEFIADHYNDVNYINDILFLNDSIISLKIKYGDDTKYIQFRWDNMVVEKHGVFKNTRTMLPLYRNMRYNQGTFYGCIEASRIISINNEINKSIELKKNLNHHFIESIASCVKTIGINSNPVFLKYYQNDF